jgi:hypothetical protein
MGILKTVYRDWEFARIVIMLPLPISVCPEKKVGGDFSYN